MPTLKLVLLCDDEIPVLRTAEIALRLAGFEVHCASDGEEAWQAIVQEMPDILITDWRMPRLDGEGLIGRCRDYVRTRDLPILILSGKSFEQSDSRMAEQWGVMGVLPKPFSPRELVAHVQRLLDVPSAVVAGSTA